MRVLNPYMRAIDSKNDHGKLRQRKHLRGAQAYLTGTHLFERERGGEMTGETTVMTGREAKALNLDMQQDYCYAVRRARETDTPNTDRLERWVCKERNIEENDPDQTGC